MRLLFVLVILVGSPFALATSPSSCERELQRADIYVRFIESALKTGDLEIADVKVLAQSPRKVNPFLGKDRTVGNIQFRNTINNLLPRLTAKGWTQVREKLDHLLQSHARLQSAVSAAVEFTRPIVTNRLVFSYRTIMNHAIAVLQMKNGKVAMAFYEGSKVVVRELPSGKVLGTKPDLTSTVQGAKLSLIEPAPGELTLRLARVKQDEKKSDEYVLEIESTDLLRNTTAPVEKFPVGKNLVFLADHKILPDGGEVFFLRPQAGELPDLLFQVNRPPLAVPVEISLKAKDMVVTSKNKILLLTNHPSTPRATIHEFKDGKLTPQWSETSEALNDPYIFATQTSGRILVYSVLSGKGLALREPFATPARPPYEIPTTAISSTTHWHESANGDILLAFVTKKEKDNFLTVYDMSDEPKLIYAESVGNANSVNMLWGQVGTRSFLIVKSHVKDLKIYSVTKSRVDLLFEGAYDFSGAMGFISGPRYGYLLAQIGRQKHFHVIELISANEGNAP